MPQPRPTRPAQPTEEGYILIGVILLLIVFVIAMTVAAPRIAASIQRDRDVETMHRGKQYIRAIQLYYRKFNAYPPNVDALVKTNEIRFLRRRYLDPITGKDDWKPVLFGQNKTPMAMGFFGQPLGGPGMGGAVLAGTGPGGGNTNPAAGSIFAGNNNTSSSPTSSIFSNSPTGSSPGSGIGGSSLGASSLGGSGIGGSSISSSPTGTSNPSGTSTTGTDASNTPATGTTDANGNPTTGSTGQTYGGAGIIGFSPASPKQSILVYKKKNHYNEWEFLYSPLMEQQMMGGGNTGAIGQPASGLNGSQPLNGPGTTSPTSPTGGTFGPGGNTGSTPINPNQP